MPHKLRAQVHELLHDYRKKVFELEHDTQLLEARKEHAKQFSDEVLDQKFHYHFHKKVDEDRAEVIQLIHSYCREALLPPIIERLAQREALIEERHKVALDLAEQVMKSIAREIEADAKAQG